MRAGQPEHSESGVWNSVSGEWKPLFGGFHGVGFSFEWHDFRARDEMDWGQSFHPESVEVCLNLAGNGWLRASGEAARLGPNSAGFYRRGRNPLRATRAQGQRHQFITAEFSASFIRAHFSGHRPGLHPLLDSFARSEPAESGVAPTRPLAEEERSLVQVLRHPPVSPAAEPLWYQGKALELAARFFFDAAKEPLFCDRQKRLARERCERVVAILREEMESPPSLEELGRRVGCSHFHLSRTFSKEMGMPLGQYLRQLRMEKAAVLLQSGKFNVTQAALEVGYSSLSHFSQTFHETFGCCPGLYGILPKREGKQDFAKDHQQIAK